MPGATPACSLEEMRKLASQGSWRGIIELQRQRREADPATDGRNPGDAHAHAAYLVYALARCR